MGYPSSVKSPELGRIKQSLGDHRSGNQKVLFTMEKVEPINNKFCLEYELSAQNIKTQHLLTH